MLLVEILVYEILANVGLETFMTWDFKLLCIRGKTEFDILFTKGEMRYVLLRLGFSYTRTTYSLARSNKEKQEILKE